MAGKNNYFKEAFLPGLWENNPVYVQLLGMCPTLGVTSTLINGVSMALAATFVLFFSSLLVSLMRNILRPQTRIIIFVTVIATFVTIVDLFLQAELPTISKALGAFVPLIVVNCIIIGRQEIFASKNPVWPSLLDALGMGLGILIAFFILSFFRELLGNWSIFGFQLLPKEIVKNHKMLVMVLPTGAFITLGVIIAIKNHLDLKAKRR